MGTFRAMDETWRFKAHELMCQLVNNLVQSMGGEADLHIDVGYPCVMNNEKVTAEAMSLASDFMGAENVSETELRMGAEDFAFYSQKVPACFYRLGTGNPGKGITSNIHTPTFNIDEDALKIGMGLMAYHAISELS